MVHKPRLLITSPSTGALGGVEVMIRDLALTLGSGDWDVYVALAADELYTNPERFPLPLMNCTVLTIHGAHRSREATYQALSRIVLEVSPDVLLNARLFAAFGAVRQAKRRGWQGRFVTMLRSFEADYLFDIRAWEPIVDAVAADGRLLALACEELCGLAPARVLDLPGGIPRPSAHSIPAPAGTPWRIGYAGRVESGQKRPEDLAPILAALGERGVAYTFELLGHGSAWGRTVNELRALLGPRLLVRGLLPREEAIPVMSTWHVFLHTAAWEGVTMAPREAMACGVVPLISEFTGFWTEGLFKPGVNCVSFPVGDCRTAASEGARLLAIPDRWQEFSSSARASQEDRHFLPENLQAWSRGLMEVLHSPRQSPDWSLVPEPPIDQGRLSRLPLPAPAREALRSSVQRLRGQSQMRWPHTSGLAPDSFFKLVGNWAWEREARSRKEREPDSARRTF